jgi:hypothetical protein
MDLLELMKFSAIGGVSGALVLQYDWLITLITSKEVSAVDDNKFPFKTRMSVFIIRLIRGLFVGVAFCFAYDYFVGFKPVLEEAVKGVLGLAFLSSMFTNIVMKKLGIFG